MQILNLKLTNFRNYTNNKFNFVPHKNIIIGNNGIGKTNIVEAIYTLALTKSFRTTVDQALIMTKRDYLIIEGTIQDTIKNSFKLVIEPNKKRAYINNNQISKLSDYISEVNVICLSSEDLKLIKDSPSVHRQLINIEISQFNKSYIKKLSIYNKILKQRNAYLKNLNNNKNLDSEYLYIITSKLIDYGFDIYNIRKDYIKNINMYLDVYFKKITKKEGLTLKYMSDYENKTKEEISEKYKKNYKNDINYGNTSFGIHLDDFIFYKDKNIAKNYLSEGEQKNAIISFKLSEIEMFYNLRKTYPIFILDDLFSEIDNSKIKNILNLLNEEVQIFITTTDLKNIDKKILKKSKIFNLKENTIEEKNYE